MRNLIGALGISLLFGSAVSAMAADLPVKYKAPPPPVTTWTGGYIGVNAGYSWNQTTGNTGCFDPTGVPNGIGCWNLNSGIVKPAGGLAGGTIGYNWQSGQTVWGLESDLQWSNTNKTGTSTNLCCVPAFTSAVGVVTAQADLRWFGTARGRVGYLVTPSTLLYVTGGLIYGQEATTGALVFPLVSYLNHGSSTRIGGTAGAGVEYLFTQNLSGKIEGLWYDMGSTTNSFISPVTGYTLTDRYRFDGGIVRAGLNYHFGGPVVAKY
jgi:outer membrane immunogenic protein